MLKKIGRPVNKLLHSFGYNLSPLHRMIPLTSGANWAELLSIQSIIDIGSNEGQFINEIEKILPGRQIIAFEPIPYCFKKMEENTKSYDVTAFNVGLSDTDGSTEINISNNFVSSSILEMEQLHTEEYPESKFIKKERIELKRLDGIISSLKINKNILIKMDVQGYEENVIKGGVKTFEEATALIIESAFEPFYKGQWVFEDVYEYFTKREFKFMGFADLVSSKKTGIPIYADGIFIKRDMITKVI